jgi:hypothetical protein
LSEFLKKIVDTGMIFECRGHCVPTGDKSRLQTYEKCRPEENKARVSGKRAAIYSKGASKAASLIKVLGERGVEVVA